MEEKNQSVDNNEESIIKDSEFVDSEVDNEAEIKKEANEIKETDEPKPVTLKDKFKAFIEKHKDIWVVIKFTLASMTAGVTELVSFTVLLFALSSLNSTSVDWFIFKYNTPDSGLGEFIAFLVSTTLAQIVAFIINRKKTFKATGNLAFSIASYVAMVLVFIIGFQTWAAPKLTTAIDNGINNLVVAQYLSKFTMMMTAFVVVFVYSKFIAMRAPKDN